ncbi:MAG: MsnO8 family LLM class oxidoreductase, partial [Solirubrobacteraceae bacterium]
MSLRLSVLDQSPVSTGSTPSEALANSLDLAQHVDRLGYTRLWYSEHHAMDLLACTAPEILVARAAAATKRIRVGSGGVMLPHYSAFKVAEVFRTLHAMFPGRIDLGVGRA